VPGICLSYSEILSNIERFQGYAQDFTTKSILGLFSMLFVPHIILKKLGCRMMMNDVGMIYFSSIAGCMCWSYTFLFAFRVLLSIG
jgi:hypothetical protein